MNVDLQDEMELTVCRVLQGAPVPRGRREGQAYQESLGHLAEMEEGVNLDLKGRKGRRARVGQMDWMGYLVQREEMEMMVNQVQLDPKEDRDPQDKKGSQQKRVDKETVVPKDYQGHLAHRVLLGLWVK